MNDEYFAKFCKEMDRVYEKRNESRVKRGKTPLSMDEFIEEAALDCKRTEKWGKIYYILPIFVCALLMIFQRFESVFLMIEYLVIELAVLYFVFIICWRFIKNSSDLKRRWIEYKRSEG